MAQDDGAGLETAPGPASRWCRPWRPCSCPRRTSSTGRPCSRRLRRSSCTVCRGARRRPHVRRLVARVLGDLLLRLLEFAAVIPELDIFARSLWSHVWFAISKPSATSRFTNSGFLLTAWPSRNVVSRILRCSNRSSSRESYESPSSSVIAMSFSLSGTLRITSASTAGAPGNGSCRGRDRVRGRCARRLASRPPRTMSPRQPVASRPTERRAGLGGPGRGRWPRRTASRPSTGLSGARRPPTAPTAGHEAPAEQDQRHESPGREQRDAVPARARPAGGTGHCGVCRGLASPVPSPSLLVSRVGPPAASTGPPTSPSRRSDRGPGPR